MFDGVWKRIYNHRRNVSIKRIHEKCDKKPSAFTTEGFPVREPAYSFTAPMTIPLTKNRCKNG